MKERAHMKASELLTIAQRGAIPITNAEVQRLVAEVFRLRAKLRRQADAPAGAPRGEPRAPCYCAETSTRNCPRHQDAGEGESR